MNFANAIAVGLKEIWAHKFRSALTMLGIILGVSSLIGMSASKHAPMP
jgi:putative ABC transport system permease protein